MTWEEYTRMFEDILNGRLTNAPYDEQSYIGYTALNASRQKRWMKRGQLNQELVGELESLTTKQSWTLITEPWCGDSPHIAPFLFKLADISLNIDFDINLRDGNDSMIENYLTHGMMSIPILVVKDELGKDLFHWGPRPKDAQTIHVNNLADNDRSTEEKKIELQLWYNKDKGEAVQFELLDKIKSLHS